MKSFDIDSIQPPRFKGLNSVEMARATLKTFFMVMLDLNVFKRDLETKCIEQDEKILSLNSEIIVLKEASGMTDVQHQAVVRKQVAMKQLISQLGESTEFMDERDQSKLNLNATESNQLTKMSLSKIVSNLRA